MKRLTKARREELLSWLQIQAKKTKDTTGLQNLATLYALVEDHKQLEDRLKRLNTKYKDDIIFRTTANEPKGRTIRLKRGDYNEQ